MASQNIGHKSQPTPRNGDQGEDSQSSSSSSIEEPLDKLSQAGEKGKIKSRKGLSEEGGTFTSLGPTRPYSFLPFPTSTQVDDSKLSASDLFEMQQRKLYLSGFLKKKAEMDGTATKETSKRKSTLKEHRWSGLPGEGGVEWTKLYVELVGSCLKMYPLRDFPLYPPPSNWDANEGYYSRQSFLPSQAASDSSSIAATCIQEIKSNVSPSSLNIRDASFTWVGTLRKEMTTLVHSSGRSRSAIGSTSSKDIQHCFVIMTANGDRHMFQSHDDQIGHDWVWALRLSAYEQAKLTQQWTREMIHDKPQFRKDVAWARQKVAQDGGLQSSLHFLVPGSPEWKQVFVSLEVPSHGAKNSSKRTSAIKDSIKESRIMFYESKKSKKPFMTLSTLYDVHIVYPDQARLVERSSLFKIEGNLSVAKGGMEVLYGDRLQEYSLASGSTTAGSSVLEPPFVILLAGSIHEMVRWVVQISQAFSLDYESCPFEVTVDKGLAVRPEPFSLYLTMDDLSELRLDASETPHEVFLHLEHILESKFKTHLVQHMRQSQLSSSYPVRIQSRRLHSKKPIWITPPPPAPPTLPSFGPSGIIPFPAGLNGTPQTELGYGSAVFPSDNRASIMSTHPTSYMVQAYAQPSGFGLISPTSPPFGLANTMGQPIPIYMDSFGNPVMFQQQQLSEYNSNFQMDGDSSNFNSTENNDANENGINNDRVDVEKEKNDIGDEQESLNESEKERQLEKQRLEKKLQRRQRRRHEKKLKERRQELKKERRRSAPSNWIQKTVLHNVPDELLPKSDISFEDAWEEARKRLSFHGDRKATGHTLEKIFFDYIRLEREELKEEKKKAKQMKKQKKMDKIRQEGEGKEEVPVRDAEKKPNSVKSLETKSQEEAPFNVANTTTEKPLRKKRITKALPPLPVEEERIPVQDQSPKAKDLKVKKIEKDLKEPSEKSTSSISTTTPPATSSSTWTGSLTDSELEAEIQENENDLASLVKSLESESDQGTVESSTDEDFSPTPGTLGEKLKKLHIDRQRQTLYSEQPEQMQGVYSPGGTYTPYIVSPVHFGREPVSPFGESGQFPLTTSPPFPVSPTSRHAHRPKKDPFKAGGLIHQREQVTLQAQQKRHQQFHKQLQRLQKQESHIQAPVITYTNFVPTKNRGTRNQHLQQGQTEIYLQRQAQKIHDRRSKMQPMPLLQVNEETGHGFTGGLLGGGIQQGNMSPPVQNYYEEHQNPYGGSNSFQQPYYGNENMGGNAYPPYYQYEGGYFQNQADASNFPQYASQPSEYGGEYDDGEDDDRPISQFPQQNFPVNYYPQTMMGVMPNPYQYGYVQPMQSMPLPQTIPLVSIPSGSSSSSDGNISHPTQGIQEGAENPEGSIPAKKKSKKRGKKKKKKPPVDPIT